MLVAELVVGGVVVGTGVAEGAAGSTGGTGAAEVTSGEGALLEVEEVAELVRHGGSS